MSSGLVKSAIVVALEDKDFAIESARIANAKSLAQELLDKAVECERNIQTFDTFANRLMKVLNAACKEDRRLKLHSTKRRKVWMKFHQARLITIPPSWSLMMRDIGVKNDDTTLLIEHINLKLYEGCVLRGMSPAAVPQVKPITSDEANALRYASGYVPFALKKKLEKRPEFKIWLDRLAVNGEDPTYLEYTKKWTKLVNRGGLFKVNDKTYHFFVEMEMRVRKLHPTLLTPTNNDAMPPKDAIFQSLLSDEDLLFSWTLVTSEFDDEDLVQELLHMVIELWLSIRGHSAAAGAWMEYYKQCNDCKVRKEHALRKKLKRKRLKMNDAESKDDEECETCRKKSKAAVVGEEVSRVEEYTEEEVDEDKEEEDQEDWEDVDERRFEENDEENRDEGKIDERIITRNKRANRKKLMKSYELERKNIMCRRRREKDEYTKINSYKFCNNYVTTVVE